MENTEKEEASNNGKLKTENNTEKEEASNNGKNIG
jgi:hypothetical protein